MLNFYKEKVERSKKQITFALLGFVSECEICMEELTHEKTVEEAKFTIDRLNDAIGAINSMYETLGFHERSLAEEVIRRREAAKDSEAAVYDHLRKESVDTLVKEV